VGWFGGAWLGGTWSGVADLVVPATCAGCGSANARLLCGECRGVLGGLAPQEVRPTPAPAGLPRCVALGAYGGVLREVLLAYKERGRYPLARPLGGLLAGAVAGGVLAEGYPAGVPVLLLPVPDAPAAARARYGDHMRRLARYAAQRLATEGWPAAVAVPVRARPRQDSVHLDTAGRSEAAARAFRVRPRQVARLAQAQRAGAVLVAVDDIVTTGATLAALSGLLRGAGLRVPVAATLAATRRR
jgi:predicted amidophosphoribosyltransferase